MGVKKNNPFFPYKIGFGRYHWFLVLENFCVKLYSQAAHSQKSLLKVKHILDYHF